MAMDASFDRGARRDKSPGDDLRDRNLMPLIRALDADEFFEGFHLKYSETETQERIRVLNEILANQATFDLAESVGIVSPLEGIKLRVKTPLSEQTVAAGKLLKVLPEAAAKHFDIQADASITKLFTTCSLFRLGALSREEAQMMLTPEELGQHNFDSKNGWLMDVLSGTLPHERSNVVSVLTSCCLENGFDTSVELLDPSFEYHYRTHLIGYLTTDYLSLVEKLGKPNSEPFPGSKVSTEWVFHYRGHVFTIYDYKDTDESGEGRLKVSRVRSHEDFSWHIGGHRGVDPNLLSEIFC